MWKTIQSDYVVIGSGIAGLMVSLMASSHGKVALVTKDQLGGGNSRIAQGGIAAAIGADDHPDLHREDTLRTGLGLSERRAVDTLVQAAPKSIRLLVQMGVPFDRNEQGRLHLGREGAHGRKRIVHAGGDATGRAVVQALVPHVLANPGIAVHEHMYAAELYVKSGECLGVIALDEQENPVFFQGKAIVLANGGLGQLYRHTTNEIGILGNGYAMAYKAGAKLRDMEFVQFHPTAFHVSANPMPLISEAVRGEGAILVNSEGEAFMERYHSWKELAPRDVVARSIYAEMAKGKKVYLDARFIPHFASRFPTIYETCRQYGVDPLKEWIPVVPAAHYTMGGVVTDTWGRTSLPRLFAVGEVASTGVHGANRLASNSLLEGAVFAQRTAEALARIPAQKQEITVDTPAHPYWSTAVRPELLQQVQTLMWEAVGLIREEQPMRQACQQLKCWLDEAATVAEENLLTTALLVVRAALWRRESRGSHYRRDYPQTLTHDVRHSLQMRHQNMVLPACVS